MKLGGKTDVSEFFFGILSGFSDHPVNDVGHVGTMFRKSCINITAKAADDSQNAFVIYNLGILHLHAHSSFVSLLFQ